MTYEDYIAENMKVMASIPDQEIEEFSRALAAVRNLGGTVWCLGNGGSATLAAHAVGDFCKTSKQFGAAPLFSLAPSEMTALQTAYSNDVAFQEGFAATLADFATEKDAIWIISVSGTSPNLLRAAEVARQKGTKVLSTVGERGASLVAESDVGILIPSDDYQVVENAHVVLMHWFTKCLQLV